MNMPKWETHLKFGNRLNDYFKYQGLDLELFLLGNILPDINNAYLVKDIKTILSHQVTHFISDDHMNHLKFYNKYKEYMNSPLLRGYFAHLYLDYYFNNDYYSKIKYTDDMDYLRHRKQDDFDVFNNKFINNKLVLNYLDNDIKESKIIKEIDITKEDLINVENYLNNNKVPSKKEYSFYNDDLLNKLFNEALTSIESIYKDLL